MDELKYKSYLKFKEDTFFKFIKNERSISSGVNLFEVLDIYKDLIKIEIDNNYSISTYAEPKGQQLLIDTLSYYENYLFQEAICESSCALCMVSGATAGLNFAFDYFSMRGFHKGVAIGYSYTLFSMLGQRFGMNLEIIVSNQRDKILPNIEEVKEYVEKNKIDFICLTEPLNPSGEMYDEQSFRALLRLCKKIGCILLIDKCQRDELQLIYKNSHFSINKIICEESMFDSIIMVNSLSKVRCIPGVRIGYVIANKEIIDYIIYLNTITYWHSSTLCSFAIAIDILYQLIYLDSINMKKYIEDFKKMLKSSISNVHIAKRIFAYINPKTIKERADTHCNNIRKQYNIIRVNYDLVRKYAQNKGYMVTNLDGGYNFCIKFPWKYTESGLKRYSTNKYKLEVFTQEDFCCDERNRESEYWIRISCAEPKEDFEEKFKIICEILKGKE